LPNWAIVIGIDRYADAAHLNLKGGVRDALAMADFLTGAPRPLVEPTRLRLLLSSTASSPSPSTLLSGVAMEEANRINVCNAIKDVARKQPDGGRLFVHFSGHGLVGPGLNGGDAILPSDYHPDDPVRSISLEGIRDFLRTSLFDEQFFFIDACRNTPLPGLFNIGQFPVTPTPEQMRPAVQQFVFCATLRGVAALEDRRTPNDERGAFSGSLLRGLRGERDAKTFDDDQQIYLVTVGSLLGFLGREVEKTVAELKLPGLPDGTQPQEPRLLGDMASVEAIIVEMAASDVPPVNLTFGILPDDAAATAEIVVRRETDLRSGPPISPATVVAVPPRDYRVIAMADGFRPFRPSLRVDAYEDKKVTIEFALDTTDGDILLAPISGEPSELALVSSDPNAIVRVIGQAGKVIAAGRERVTMFDLPDGSYRGQLILPDGILIERMIELAGGAGEHTIAAPARPRTPTVLLTIEKTEADAERRPVVFELDSRSLGGDARATTQVNVPLPVFDGWFTRLHVLRAPDSRLSVNALFVRPTGIDPEKAQRLLTAQQYYGAGLFDAAIDCAKEDIDNPIGALLEAYSLLRVTFMAHAGARLPSSPAVYAATLRRRVERLLDIYPESSDVAVLRAELALMSDDMELATVVIRGALDLGLPLLAFATQRLAAHVRSLDVEHQARGRLDAILSRDHRVSGWILTAWV
jgi:Caspase domain